MADFDYSGYDFSQPGATANAAYDRLISLGVPAQSAAGAVGSLMGESGKGLNTKALNRGDGADGSDSIGMGQWNQDRATALMNQGQRMGLSWTAPQVQIEHIANELTGTHKHVLNALKNGPDDVANGANIWTSKYEVAGTPHMDRRIQNGMDFAQQIAGRGPADPVTTGGTVDPWSPEGKAMNPPTVKLPVPALSPQFQQGQLNPAQSATVGPDGSVSLAPNRMLVGSNELQARGPMAGNTFPQPGMPAPNNITNPTFNGSSGIGQDFDAAFGAAQPGQMRGGRFSTDPVPPQVRPTPAYPDPNYTPTPRLGALSPTAADAAGRPAGALSPSFWSGQDGNGNGGGILGMGNMSDFGKRLERMAGWLNPQGAQGMAAAAGAQNGDRNAATNEMTAKNNVDISQRGMKLKEAPTPNTFDSANGKFRIKETTNPLTGEVMRTREAIPEDEQDAVKAAFKPSATVEKMLQQDEDQSQKNLAVINDARDFRQMIRDGKVDMSLLGQTAANLQVLANRGDEKADNALKLQAFIQSAANNQLRGEKGVQTDSDAKRIMGEILAGNAKYSNKAIYDWMGTHMEKVRDDINYRSRRAQTAISRYGKGYDPDGYMAQDWQNRSTQAQSAYDNDRAAPAYTGAAAAPGPAAPGHIDPVVAAYRKRMGLN